MKTYPDIRFYSEDRLILYLLKHNVGFRATHIVERGSSDDGEAVTNAEATKRKRMHYFDKGNGVYAVLRFLTDTLDPSQRLARIVRVNFRRNHAWAETLFKVAAKYTEDCSTPLSSKDRALLLLHETLAHWSTGTREFFRKAISLADQAILLDPSLAQALNGKGASQASLGDTPGAIKTYLQAIRADSRCVRPWLNLGNRHSAHGMTDRALFAYRIGVERPPLWDGDEKLQARAALNLRTAGGGSAETRWLLAHRNAELDHLLTQHFLSEGGSISPEVSRGAMFGHRGDWDKALVYFTRAVANDPRDLAARNNRARALNQLGRYAEALSVCDAILRQKPDYCAAGQTRAESLLMLGRDSEALACLEALSDDDPDNPALLYYRGLIADEMQRWPEAAQHLGALAIETLPTCEQQHDYARRRLQEILAWHDGGLARGTKFGRGMVSERRNHLVALLECYGPPNPSQGPENHVAGCEAFQKGNFPAALQRFETEARRRPTSTIPLCCMAMIFLARGGARSLTRTVALCNRVLGIDDHNVDALVLKAEALLKGARQKGAGLRGAGLDPEHPHCTQARECYERAATIDARHPAALYWKALAEDALGDTDAASRTFRQFVVVAPDELASHLHYARTRLHHMEFWRWRNQQRALSAEVEQHV